MNREGTRWRRVEPPAVTVNRAPAAPGTLAPTPSRMISANLTARRIRAHRARLNLKPSAKIRDLDRAFALMVARTGAAKGQ